MKPNLKNLAEQFPVKEKQKKSERKLNLLQSFTLIASCSCIFAIVFLSSLFPIMSLSEEVDNFHPITQVYISLAVVIITVVGIYWSRDIYYWFKRKFRRNLMRYLR